MTMPEKNEQQDEQQRKTADLSRRSVLKLLAATGAAVTVGRLLPGSWSTPSVSAAPPPYPVGCSADDFPLQILDSRARLMNATSGRWRVSFTYNDTLGMLNINSAVLSAVVNTSGILQPIYTKEILFDINGSLTMDNFYSYEPDCIALNSTVRSAVGDAAPIEGYDGEGGFNFEYLPPTSQTTLAATEDIGTLVWNLTQPADRQSNNENTILNTPTAVSLQDFLVDDGAANAGKAAAVAGAAALGAATIALAGKRRDQGQQPTESDQHPS